MQFLDIISWIQRSINFYNFIFHVVVANNWRKILLDFSRSWAKVTMTFTNWMIEMIFSPDESRRDCRSPRDLSVHYSAPLHFTYYSKKLVYFGSNNYRSSSTFISWSTLQRPLHKPNCVALWWTTKDRTLISSLTQVYKSCDHLYVVYILFSMTGELIRDIMVTDWK